MSTFSYIFCDTVTSEQKQMADNLIRLDDAIVVAEEYNKSLGREDDMCDYIEEWESHANNPINVWQKSNGNWFKIIEEYITIH